MSAPPPLPVPPRPIRAFRFNSSQWGLRGSSTRERAMMDSAESEAEKWLAENPYAEVVAITSSLSDTTAMVTVWCRV